MCKKALSPQSQQDPDGSSRELSLTNGDAIEMYDALEAEGTHHSARL